MTKTKVGAAHAVALEDTRALKTRIDAKSDVLNVNITRAEAYLAGLGYGVEAELELGRDADSGGWEVLRFGRLRGAWRLLYVWGVDEEAQEPTPLVSAPRHVRIKAAALLPQMTQRFHQVLLKQEADIDAANAWIDGLVAAEVSK